MTDRTIVVSATNVLAAGYLVVPTDRRTPAGEPAGALFAVARAISRVLQWKTPARAVAVIGPAKSGWPELLASQHARLAELVRGLGFAVAAAEEEAPVVASYVEAALAAGDDVVVVGRDKRYAQLVGDRVWWYDSNKDVRYTEDVVAKRFGVGPAAVADWLALVGDEDALPGVSGIGAKGATTLLETYASIDAALTAPDAIEGRIGKAVRAALADIPRELARARLDRTRALPVALADATYRPPPLAERNAMLEAHGFVELLGAAEAAVEVEIVDALPDVREPAIETLIEDNGDVAGVALATTERAWYVPRKSPAWPALAAWLASPAPKLGHDLLAATIALRHAGITLAGITADSQCASHLCEPSNWAPHDLEVDAKLALGRALPTDEQIRGVGQKRRAWSALPVEQAAAAAGQRAQTSAALWQTLAPRVDAHLLADYLAMIELCARMELHGLTIDLAALDHAREALVAIDHELAQQIYALAGHELNINSGPQLGKLLFEELKLPIAGHTKTGWSTAIDALEKIEHAHPIVPLVIRWRLLRRLRDFWVVALRDYIGADGRVHSRSHPARSFSGHLVNSNPDLARVPGRTPEMQLIRRAFVAAPGHVLMSVDFNQLGLHVLAHLTKDPALVEPLRARADMHRLTAAAVLDKPADAVTLDERQLGKVINFATFAGQGASALALQLGVSAAEAKEYIARFDARYAQVRAFQDEQLRLARERGYIQTIAGRHWPIGGLESLDSQIRSYAERLARRATHEGSVADVARKAMLDADRALRAAGLHAQAIVQVVDEVLFEVPSEELAAASEVAAQAMRHAYELEVPLVVGVWAGPTWADLDAL